MRLRRSPPQASFEKNPANAPIRIGMPRRCRDKGLGVGGVGLALETAVSGYIRLQVRSNPGAPRQLGRVKKEYYDTVRLERHARYRVTTYLQLLRLYYVDHQPNFQCFFPNCSVSHEPVSVHGFFLQAPTTTIPVSAMPGLMPLKLN